MIDLAFESTRTVTQEEFVRWVEDRHRAGDVHQYELLNGRVIMNPPAGYPHGSVAGRIAAVLSPFIYDNALGEYLDSSQGFALPSGDTVEPDHSFVSQERWDAMPPPAEGEFLQVTPDLVVEILSASTASRDRGEKKAIYERNGVREYWIVDPRARAVTVFTSTDGRFDTGRAFDEGGAFRSSVLEGLEVAVARLMV